MDFFVAPAWIFVVAALVCLIARSPFRKALVLMAPLVSLSMIISLPGVGATGRSPLFAIPFLDYTLIPLAVDRLSQIFGFIFSLISFLAALYGLNQTKRGGQVAALLYGAGALGVCFAGDYLSLYLYWELMAIASYYLIVSRDQESSRAAGTRYLFVHLAGGIALLAGILMHLHETGSLHIETMLSHEATTSSWLILVGFALNAAVLPLHAWLPDAYPKATIGGAIFLSALTTKTAVYTLARVYAGWEILIPLGVAMALYGVIYAFLAKDIRGILSYHIVSQVGFMVAGIGLGTSLALNGAVAHAFCHILYKALLFMGCGALITVTGREKLIELGGLFKETRMIFFLYMVGALSISGFPLFNGFISKSLVIDSFHEVHETFYYALLNIASMGTFLSVGLKLPYFAWFDSKKEDVAVGTTGRSPLPKTMTLAMIITASLCFVLGVYPNILYRYLLSPIDYQPYTWAHLLHTGLLLGGTGIIFAIFLNPIRKMKKRELWDFDWFYRRPAKVVYAICVEFPGTAFDKVRDLFVLLIERSAEFLDHPDEKREGTSIGNIAASLLLVTILLALFLMH